MQPHLCDLGFSKVQFTEEKQDVLSVVSGFTVRSGFTPHMDSPVAKSFLGVLRKLDALSLDPAPEG